MARYEQLEISIVLQEQEDIITASLGDNEVPELGEDGTDGGIFG